MTQLFQRRGAASFLESGSTASGSWEDPSWTTVSASTATLPMRPQPVRRSTQVPEAATAREEDFEAIERAVDALNQLVALEELEYGVNTPLMPALDRLIREHGKGAVLELAASIESQMMDPQLASWTLRFLGRFRDSSTHGARRWLLERGLHSDVPMIRDGAALGLASLCDIRTIPALRSAADRERYSRLRRNIEKAVQRVERSL